MTNIETPEGWQPSGPCFTRVYDGKFAVIDVDQEEGEGKCWVFSSYSPRESDWLPLPEAVAWANDQLGVPKPVEVVEIEFADGSVLVHDTEKKRWSGLYQYSGVWVVLNVGTHIPNKDAALEAARAYVRGDA